MLYPQVTLEIFRDISKALRINPRNNIRAGNSRVLQFNMWLIAVQTPYTSSTLVRMRLNESSKHNASQRHPTALLTTDVLSERNSKCEWRGLGHAVVLMLLPPGSRQPITMKRSFFFHPSLVSVCTADRLWEFLWFEYARYVSSWRCRLLLSRIQSQLQICIIYK